MKIPDLSKIKGFQWDAGNTDKSYEKHGITPNKSEEVFLDGNLKVERDVKHSEVEDRFIALGKTIDGRILFEIFTIRRNNIRIISARTANKKERYKYEKAKKDSKVQN